MSSRILPGTRMIAGVIAALALLAACSDDSGGGGGGGPALSEDDFVAAYSEICVGVSDDISALDPGSFEEAQAAASSASGIVEDGISALRDLTPPENIADDVATGTDALARTGEVFSTLADIDSEEEFAAKGAEIDEARGEAQDVLGPLGIECESGGASASTDGSGTEE